MALQSWDKVISGVDIYVRTIHGTAPAAMTFSRTAMTARMATAPQLNGEIQMQDTKTLALAADLALQDTSRNLCRDIFAAPPVKGTFPRPSDIQRIAGDYAVAADNLRSISHLNAVT